MGGLFSSPSPPAPTPAPVVSTTDPNEESARMARERRRRAQGETIATSYRGIGEDNRKKLLGE